MAKGNSGGEDRAKVKLRVIEFELEGSNASVENSIRQITNSLTVRPATPKQLPAKPAKEISANGAGDETEVTIENAEVVDTETVEVTDDNEIEKKAAKKSKPKPPTYIHNLDLVGKGPNFKDFAKEKAPTTKNKRYLIAAYWLKEYGSQETVNADKIYTCFKTAAWPTDFNDWRATFDNLVHSEHMRKVGKSEFAINPLGESAVTDNTEA
jgi:hypothetical protein